MKIALLLLALCPAEAFAEGARLTLSCQATLACNAAATCAEASEALTFTLAPESTDARGTGSYAVTLNGIEGVEPIGLSHIGPWLWHSGNGTRHTLTLTGETTATYLRQTLDNGPDGPLTPQTIFLTCDITG